MAIVREFTFLQMLVDDDTARLETERHLKSRRFRWPRRVFNVFVCCSLFGVFVYGCYLGVESFINNRHLSTEFYPHNFDIPAVEYCVNGSIPFDDFKITEISRYEPNLIRDAWKAIDYIPPYLRKYSRFYYKLDRLCVAVDYGAEFKRRFYSQADELSADLNMMFSAVLRHTDIVWFNVLQSGSYKTRSRGIELDRDTYHAVSFETFKTYLYDCRNYGETSFIDQSDCMMRCVKKQVKLDNVALPYEYPVFEEEWDMYNITTESNATLETICLSLCGQVGCYLTEYLLKVEEREVLFAGQNKTQLDLRFQPLSGWQMSYGREKSIPALVTDVATHLEVTPSNSH